MNKPYPRPKGRFDPEEPTGCNLDVVEIADVAYVVRPWTIATQMFTDCVALPD